jgi:hypothetical protein
MRDLRGAGSSPEAAAAALPPRHAPVPPSIPSVGGFRPEPGPRGSNGRASAAARLPPSASSGLHPDFEYALPTQKRSAAAASGGRAAAALDSRAAPPRALSAAKSRPAGGVLSLAGRSSLS